MTKKINKPEPSRLNYRAYVTIDHYEQIMNEPKGTGSHYIPKTLLAEVIQLNLSTGNMRVRYTDVNGLKATIDLPIQNLMQSTGYEDIHGTEIYQDDYCDTKYFKNCKVVWWEGGWALKTQEEPHIFLFSASNIEVIGYIPQN